MGIMKRWRQHSGGGQRPDLRIELAGISMASPIIAASGTFGHGSEFAELADARALGAVTVKSLSAEAWAGNPSPRVAPAGGGMINAVGLQNSGVEAWIREELPPLRALGANIIVSIWGRSAEAFAQVATALGKVAADIAAVEINASCPNLEARSQIFAHDPVLLSSVVQEVCAAVAAWTTPRPVFTKLSPNVTDIRPMVGAAMDAGSSGVTMGNTMMGLAIDPKRRVPVLGNGGGGYSGAPIKPIVLRLVSEIHAAFPSVPIIGTGGVCSGSDAYEMLLAGASAVGVGTASFANPRAPWRIRQELEAFMTENGDRSLTDVIGNLQWK